MSIMAKGWSWSGVNLNVLPEIDFDKLEKQIDLQLTQDTRELIKIGLSDYICQMRGWKDKPSPKSRKASLKRIVKACKVLEPIFELDSPGISNEDEYDPLKLHEWKCIMPLGQYSFDGEAVADYLARCRGQAEDELKAMIRREEERKEEERKKGKEEKSKKIEKKNDKPGPRKDFARPLCLEWLHKVFVEAGGDGRIKRYDNVYTGPFYLFAGKLFSLIGVPLSPGSIYENLQSSLYYKWYLQRIKP
ncbi:conserved protein of unknown function [Pseudodesulfovibrio profundus]|uniref:Uncharacterized protein n=1 Tax=Pseudodesulfovibrio profundus TaxID=57320 RepID=A0A2C8FCE0_9BACT|nr:hypothetical protein [Pseudodesulfovibrio profundus]SOB60196.1 conserved protein of unknown function [Pseudodesulfovibrio profundus]